MHVRLAPVALAAILPILGAPCTVRAELRERVALALEAPPECISERELSARVERILDRPFFVSRPEAAVIARATLVSRDGTWSFTLELVTNDGAVIGRREARYAGGSCRSLDPSISVITAILVELPVVATVLRLAEAETSDPADDGPATDPVPLPSSTPPAPSPQAPTGRAPAWEVRTAALAALSVGLLPDVAFGAGALFALVPDTDWPALVLEARWLAPSTRLDEAGRGGTFWIADAHLGACPSWAIHVLRLGGCVTVGAGAIVADAIGLEGARSGTLAPLLSARAAFEARLVLAPLDVRVTIGADVPLLRHEFVRDQGTDRQTLIHAPAPAALAISLGIGAIGSR